MKSITEVYLQQIRLKTLQIIGKNKQTVTCIYRVLLSVKKVYANNYNL